MTATTVTLTDAEDVLTVLAGVWGPMTADEADGWRAALVGRPAGRLVSAVDRVVERGGQERPTVAAFVAALDPPPSPAADMPQMFRDNRRATTYIRVCQACCRRFAAGDTEWRDLLGWDRMPTPRVFEDTMRALAGTIDRTETDIDHAITTRLRSAT